MDLQNADNRRAARGAAALEFAIILPILSVLLMGLVDFGQMLHVRLTLVQAVREGARVAVDGEGDAAIRSAVERVAGPVVLSSLTVTRLDDRATVSAAAAVDPILWRRDGATTIRRSAVARVMSP